jgi:prolyl-tRNA synthetase
MFLRTTEFLWQEGHTAHATAEEAIEESHKMIGVYRDFAENFMAMPVIVGTKTENEKFAGAVDTFTIEAMMGDKRALQSGTSHYLGQNFAKAFDVMFQNEKNEQEYVFASSWGVSTRLVGALIMTHGDDKGLILPPKLAPYQLVLVPIYRDDEAKEKVMPYVKDITDSLDALGLRYHVDSRETLSPGFKFNDWEMKGVPLRIEVGPRDVDAGKLVCAKRLSGEKAIITKKEFKETVVKMLDDIQFEMLASKKAFRKENTLDINSYDELKAATENGGFARAFWAGSSDDEKRIQEETKTTVRCIPFEQSGKEGTCFYTGKKTTTQVIFAKSY